MLTSFAYIFILGLIMSGLFKKINLPGLLGMILTGLLLGPHVLNLLDPGILDLSADLREIALLIILTRAGLALDLKDLKQVGRPAILMCFVPASFEILGMILIAPILMDITILQAAILGTVIAAVSPAVIVPKMLQLMEQKRGTGEKIPQMIMAGASVDDVFVIVLFTAFTGLAQGQDLEATQFLQIPVSILTGVVVGLILGYLFQFLFKKIHIRDSAKVMLLLSLSFLMIGFADFIEQWIPMSGLLAVMSVGIAIQKFNTNLAKRLSVKYSKLWVGAEIILFVLVGAGVDPSYAVKAGPKALLLLALVLIFRVFGVWLCLIRTTLNLKERFFTMIAYTPKATVQAAIGSLPLAMGLAGGELILTVAVLAILFTAPLGALGIDLTSKRFLSAEQEKI